MTLRLYNTLGREKQGFEPLEPGHVRMYTCGPTVHDFAHIGNFRAFLVADLLRRHLEFSGYRVTQVMNITDIDDRIINKAAADHVTARDFASRYEDAFMQDLGAVRAERAEHYPRATDHIPEMLDLVDRLVDTQHAYESEGDVYFRVDSFPEYGHLSHLDRAGLKAGARVAQDDYDKESASDFALWKHAEPIDEEVGAAWVSRFGRGRPGWHIECSAMSMKYLGETFDIHGGGVDLEFPHHENEIAQSQAATGQPLARYWIHNDHLVLTGGAKMSKRLQNFTTLREMLEAGEDPLALRFFLMANAHYRQKLTLDEGAIHAAGEQVRRLQEIAERLQRLKPRQQVDDAALVSSAHDTRARYRAALDDDLNLPQGLGYVFELVRESNAALDRGAVGAHAREALRAVLADVDRHLDILTPAATQLDEEIERLIREREEARARRDFARSDAIREQLRALGIVLEDSRDGVRWRRAQPSATRT